MVNTKARVVAFFLALAGAGGGYGILETRRAEEAAKVEAAKSRDGLIKIEADPTGARAPAKLFDPTRISEGGDLPQDCTPDTTQVSKQPKLYADPVTGLIVTKPTIIQISITGCPPCMTFMASGKKAFEDVGWQVLEDKDKTQAPVYPSYRVLHKGEWHWHYGLLTSSALRRLMGKEDQRDVGAMLKGTQANALTTASIPSSGGRTYTIRGQAWTTASLRSHLYGGNHGYARGSLDHLTFSELNDLHTADHEGHASPATVLQTTGSQVLSSACPTCPQSSSSYVRQPQVQMQRGRRVVRTAW